MSRTIISWMIVGLLIVVSSPILLVTVPHQLIHVEPLNGDEEVTQSCGWEMVSCGFEENLGQLNIPEVMFYTKSELGIIGLGNNLIGEWNYDGNLIKALVFEGETLFRPSGVGLMRLHSNYILGRGIFTGVKHYSGVEFFGMSSNATVRIDITKEGVLCTFSITNPESIERITITSEEVGLLKHVGSVNYWNVPNVDWHLARTSKGHRKSCDIIIADSNTTFPITEKLLFIGSYGGEPHHRGASVVTDRDGNIYIAGYTVIKGTMLPFETADDSFVMKVAPDGNSLEYITYIGGDSNDKAASICVDDEGFIYITGDTFSSDFPADNVLDDTDDIVCDCFVLKLNPDGTTLEYSSLIGGHLEDEPHAMVIDDMNRVYVTGETNSEDFPTTPGCWDESYNGGLSDCFVFRLNANGSAIEFSTFIDAEDDENGHSSAHDIELDSEGNIVIGGGTSTDTFPLVNAYDDTYNGDHHDCFLLVLSSDGSSIIGSTLIGGSGGESVVALDLNVDDCIIATGTTSSSNFPIVNGFDTIYAYVDAFLFKMSTNCSSLLYSTYLGAEINENGNDVTVDSHGNAYVTGWTNSEDFPTKNAFCDTLSGEGRDAFLTVVNQNGTRILYSTYIGGSGSDSGVSICLGPEEERLCMLGVTGSADFPTINCNAHPGEGEDSFLVVYGSSRQSTYPSNSQEGLLDSYVLVIIITIALLSIPLVIFYQRRSK
jgi:hypothetical protein